MQEVLVKMEGIQKYFPGVKALNNAYFELLSGEVHALLGENGAGKSTLMKVLTGIYSKDGGKIFYKGEEINLLNTLQAQRLGISMIHQELNLVPDLTVAQNIMMGKEPRKGFLIDKNAEIRETKKLFDELRLDIDPCEELKNLSVAKQQMVEIARALSYDSSIIIMDEPSAALTEAEISELFRFIRDLKAKGVGIVYISHRMNELFEITDRITVMRDGEYIGTKNTAETNNAEVVGMMVGRTIYEEPKTQSSVPEDAPVVLEVKNLNARGVKNVSFTLKKGEILGFAGLMGAGRTETMRTIFGADEKVSGEIYVNGSKVEINSPYDAVKLGIGYLSEDRKAFGLLVDLSVGDNIGIASLDRYLKRGFVDDKKIFEESQAYVEMLGIKTTGPKQLVKNLSGGNQQKVVLAKWLMNSCDIIIFDEPTRGIDVGAKNEIYKLMNSLVKQGKSIIMVSSELQEVLRMSDRVMVMCEGAVRGEIPIEEASQQLIMTYATQHN